MLSINTWVWNCTVYDYQMNWVEWIINRIIKGTMNSTLILNKLNSRAAIQILQKSELYTEWINSQYSGFNVCFIFFCSLSCVHIHYWVLCFSRVSIQQCLKIKKKWIYFNAIHIMYRLFVFTFIPAIVLRWLWLCVEYESSRTYTIISV